MMVDLISARSDLWTGQIHSEWKGGPLLWKSFKKCYIKIPTGSVRLMQKTHQATDPLVKLGNEDDFMHIVVLRSEK